MVFCWAGGFLKSRATVSGSDCTVSGARFLGLALVLEIFCIRFLLLDAGCLGSQNESHEVGAVTDSLFLKLPCPMRSSSQ